MSKTQEQLDEELFASLLPTIDEMFDKIFPAKMFCEAEIADEELIEEPHHFDCPAVDGLGCRCEELYQEEDDDQE